MKTIHIRFLFLGIVAAILIASLIMYNNLNNYVEEVNLIRNSNVIIGTTQLVMSTIKDAEIGHRGFQLTRDTVYLEPYYSAIAQLPAQLRQLDNLVSRNRDQKPHVDSLKTLITDQFLIISNILANARRTTLYMDRYESNLLARGKNNMETIRHVVKTILEEEEQSISMRTHSETNYRMIAPITLITYTILALVAVTFLFTRILESLHRREAAEKLLRENVSQLQVQKALLEESKILLNQAEALAEMGSWKWTARTDQLVWTSGLYSILNINPQQVITWDCFLENVYDEDKPFVETFLNEVKEKNTGSTVDFRVLKDGQVQNLFISAKAQQKKQAIDVEILGTVIDITERKEYEKQLQQYNIELQRSNEDLEQFASVASHDLQEPLRKIRAFGDRLSAKYLPVLGDQGADYVVRMQSAAARMQTLIEDLLAFSRVSRGEDDFELINTEITLHEVVDDIDMLLSRNKAQVIIQPITSFLGNRVQIKRLFQNLISNAVKFHKENEAPVVAITGKDISHFDVLNEFGVSLAASQFVRISVKDNGIGFDVQYVEKIFNIFQRLHGRTAYEGTGIGLAICRKIVANHNGYITANSVENEGSEFIIILPIS